MLRSCLTARDLEPGRRVDPRGSAALFTRAATRRGGVRRVAEHAPTNDRIFARAPMAARRHRGPAPTRAGVPLPAKREDYRMYRDRARPERALAPRSRRRSHAPAAP
jgi:hypothetical protein